MFIYYVVVVLNCPNDIVFVVDDSGSIGIDNFARVKTFISRLVGRLDIDSGNTRVGIVTFSTGIRTVFNLSDHQSVTSLQTNISSLSYYGGRTETAEALAYVRTTMLTSSAGARSNVPKVVVVVTDGQSSDFNATVVSVKFIALRCWYILKIRFRLRLIYFIRDVIKDLNPKARTKDHTFVLKDNQGPRPRTISLLIGRNMDDSSVVWKYVSPVRATVAHQNQDPLSLKAKAKNLNFKAKTRTNHHNFVQDQGHRQHPCRPISPI